MAVRMNRISLQTLLGVFLMVGCNNPIAPEANLDEPFWLGFHTG